MADCMANWFEFAGIGSVDPRLLVMFSGGDTKEMDSSVSVALSFLLVFGFAVSEY